MNGKANLKSSLLIAFSTLLSVPLGAGVGVWTTNGPANPDIVSVAVDPTSSLEVYAGGTEAGSTPTLFRSTDGGITWAPAILLQTPGRPGAMLHSVTALAVHVDRSIPRPLAGNGSSFFQSPDGQSWALASWMGTVTSGVPTTPPFVVAGNATLESCVFGFTTPPDCHTYRGMALVPQILPPTNPWLVGRPPGDLTALAFDPVQTTTMYGAVGDLIFKSSSGGASWVQTSFSDAGADSVIALAISPDDRQRVFAGSHGSGILRSTDAGASWSAINAGLPAGISVRAIAFSPNSPATIFLGTDGGVFRTADSGDHWTALNDGLTTLDVTSLAIDSTGQFLHAGTNGGGVFDIELAPPACADPHTLCLQGGRFQISVQWTDFNGNTGLASVVPGATSNNSGVMWFFSPDNWELLIKVLDGCVVNGHYWVLGAAATNVAYTIQVTDTQTGEVKTYTNPLGTVSPAITDTTAFGNCP